MVTAVGYAYPWDLDDPAAADRAAGLGLDAVAVAASYHSTRAATPLHPTRRTVVARHAAFYLPVRESAWRGARLTPAAPTWPGSFTDAREALRAAGLPVHAWVVLTHNTRLGTAHPDLTVRNAFGESYEYALCPASDEVADYCATLVAETLELGEPDGVILEACGPLGVDHGGHHDKLEFAAWTPVQRALLSLCFGAGCASRSRAAAIDPDRLRTVVRAALHPDAAGTVATRLDGVATGLGGMATAAPRPDPMPSTVDDVLGELAGPVRAVRAGLAAGLRERLVEQIRAARPDARIALHANPDPYATGPFATVAHPTAAAPAATVEEHWTPANEAESGSSSAASNAPSSKTAASNASSSETGPGPDALVANCWRPDGAEAVLAALRDLGPGAAIGGYVRPDTLPAEHGGLAALVRRYLAAGLGELHLYHLGLLPEPALRRLAGLIALTRRSTVPPRAEAP